MNIVCLDLEGVLVPEIWIAFSEASGIPELRRTTRDEPDYDKLMRWRGSRTGSAPGTIRWSGPWKKPAADRTPNCGRYA